MKTKPEKLSGNNKVSRSVPLGGIQLVTNQTKRFVFLLILLIGTQCSKIQERKPTSSDEFNKNIRTTEARTPEEERLGFQLPEGFTIELFASEPDIGKPLNMAFDDRGRLWLTQSNEYPFPNDAGKDKVIILEDTDHDGRADKFITFADSLNIPIGITPVKDGAIVYSIPHVYHLIDHDGDNRADERKIILSGFEFKDTHGMVNNFLRGLDGWIHADHGYKNSSRVVGTSGRDTVVMTSGNTFRFLPDGSRVELTTTGRVNPFGLVYDDLGYMYGVDCHSSPIYQLIRGGDYPHFGKKPTGIGYAPYMMRHEYGSTALAGLEYTNAPYFPADFQNNFYYGDVVMSRVLRSSMNWNGTTPVPKQEHDFIISDDPWFRPVDIQLGPDGALYVADFYNRIIGHYEVPLDHPGRDRERGRIWRITYTGKEPQHNYKAEDWSKASLDKLLDGLGHPNPTVRALVADRIEDFFAHTAPQALTLLVQSPDANALQRRHALWVLFRLNALPMKLVANALADTDLSVRVHALHILFEFDTLDAQMLERVRELINDPNPHVQRAAAMVLARYPNPVYLQHLLHRMAQTTQEDTHLIYALRQAMRDQLRAAAVMEYTLRQVWKEAEAEALASVLVGVESESAARFLFLHMKNYPVPEEEAIRYTRHAARYLPVSSLTSLIAIARNMEPDNLDMQYALFEAYAEGLAQRGVTVDVKGKQWGIALAQQFLEIPLPKWKMLPTGNLSYTENPWTWVQLNTLPDSAPVLATFNDGVHTGTLISPEFLIPETISFLLVGHKKASELGEIETATANKVQLIISETGEVVAEDSISEEHEARTVTWNIASHAGKLATLVVVDGSAARREYIGIGDILPREVKLPAGDPSQMSKRLIFACRVAGRHKVTFLQPYLVNLLQSEQADITVRVAAAQAMFSLKPDTGLALTKSILENKEESPLLQLQLLRAVSALATPTSNRVLNDALSTDNFATKKEIAMALARTTDGANLLFDAANELRIAPGLLLDKKVGESLEAVMTPAQRARLAALTKDVKPPDAEIQSMIDYRLAGLDQATASREVGIGIFNQSCLACHEVNGQGGNIGPQLDGIGNWGARALAEKILDPNRNISQAFINYSIKRKDGTTLTGLWRREEGNLLVFANVAGQEFTIPKTDILEKKATPFTLMPDQFGQTISESDFHALLTYLLSLK